MSPHHWPPLDPNDWMPTRDTLHQRVRMVGAIAKALAEPHPHWWHAALLPDGTDLVTRPLSGPDGEFIVSVDLAGHSVFVEGGGVVPLDQPCADFVAGIGAALAAVGADVSLDPADFASPDVYDGASVERYAAALTLMVPLLEPAIGSRPGETSPTQVWPHHFDLAATWFSGRLVPGVDPTDVENATELVGLGFSTGDGTVAEPYCYAYAYPTPGGLETAVLPGPAAWHSEGFTGGVLRYGAALGTGDPEGAISAFWRTFLAEAAARMV
jgi:hypothetical protein